MTALLLAVFVASVLGSLHCAGMCGAFCVLAVGSRDGRATRVATQAAYHGGRLLVYCTLGAAAGALGAVVDLGGSLVGAQRVAALLAGGMMVVFGLVALARLAGLRVHSPALPKPIQQALATGHARALALAPVPRAAAIGLLTALLPCGWLYAFVVTSAGTGHALWGVATMAAFWLGTLPILASLGVSAQVASGILGRNATLVTAVAVVVIGLLTAAGRMRLDPRAMLQAQAAPVAGAQQGELAASVEHVQSLDAEQMPCCRADEADTPQQPDDTKAP